MPFWKSKSKPPKIPAATLVNVNTIPSAQAPEIQVSVYPPAGHGNSASEPNNNHFQKSASSSTKSTPKNSPKSSAQNSPVVSRKSNGSGVALGVGLGLSTDALDNLKTSASAHSSRFNSPRGSVTGVTPPRVGRPRTLQVPSPHGSRQGSIDVVEVDSGTGSLVTSEDESVYLERLRDRGSTSSTASSSGKDKDSHTSFHGSSNSVNLLTQNVDHLRRLSAGSLTSCMDNAKQLFETKWALALEAEQNPNLPPITTKADFYKQARIGNGCYGDILLVQHKTTGQFHAMKVCSKAMVKKKNQLEQLKYERRILASITFPFVTTLQYHFEDSLNTYTVMDFIAGGDMFHHLRKQKYFPESQVRFYGAQLVLTLEYLHSVGLVFRDLKPENVLIDTDGYLKLTDFGLSKRIDSGRRWTFCGTPEYIAPEIILCRGYSKAVDWWALGVLLYEMYMGHPPFQGETPLDIYERIVSNSERIAFPRSFPVDLKDLIKNLLQIDLTRRYGNLRNGVNDIKYHRWFIKTNWEAIYRKEEKPPMIPNVKHPGDARNFTTA